MVIAGAPSDILSSSPGPMSLISATIGPVSQETDHTSPALGLETSSSLGFLFWQGLAAPETSSLSGQGKKGSSTARRTRWSQQNGLPPSLAGPNHKRPGDPSPPCLYGGGEWFSTSKPFASQSWPVSCCALASVRPLHPSGSLC